MAVFSPVNPPGQTVCVFNGGSHTPADVKVSFVEGDVAGGGSGIGQRIPGGRAVESVNREERRGSLCRYRGL